MSNKNVSFSTGTTFFDSQTAGDLIPIRHVVIHLQQESGIFLPCASAVILNVFVFFIWLFQKSDYIFKTVVLYTRSDHHGVPSVNL